MYRATLAIDPIGRADSESAVNVSMRCMGHILMALVNVNKELMRSLPGQLPLLYDSGVRYDRMEPPPGSVCGDDDWADIVTVYRAGKGDCEDLACIRVAELNYHFNLPDVVPYIMLQRSGKERARHLYHIMVRWPAGLKSYPPTVFMRDGMYLECPSTILGMTEAA